MRSLSATEITARGGKEGGGESLLKLALMYPALPAILRGSSVQYGAIDRRLPTT